jgi:hypothetical protein
MSLRDAAYYNLHSNPLLAGNTKYMDENPELFWTREEIGDLTDKELEELQIKHLGKFLGRPAENRVLLKTFYQDERLGAKVPEHIKKEDSMYSTRVGLVLGFGLAAYRNKKVNPSGAVCKVGGWVKFKKYDDDPFLFAGISCSTIFDFNVNHMVFEPDLINTKNIVDRG